MLTAPIDKFRDAIVRKLDEQIDAGRERNSRKRPDFQSYVHEAGKIEAFEWARKYVTETYSALMRDDGGR